MPKKKKKKLLFLVIISVISLLIIVVIAGLFLSQNNSNQPIIITCPNGICESDEYKIDGSRTYINCPQDCDICVINPESCGNNPIITCPNGICESDEWRFSGDTLIINCPQDCDHCKIDPPVCGNNRCEVYCNIDEFNTCQKDCGGNGGGTNCDSWSIVIFYITQNNVYDTNYKLKIDSTMSKFKNLMSSYDGTQVTWNIIKADVPSTINIKKDISDGSWISVDDDIINAIPNFETYYDMYDITFLVVDGTSGGAYSINYMSPIWFSASAMEGSADGLEVAHEFFHPFGLKDVYPGCASGVTSQCGCLMGDLSSSNTRINLCEQTSKYKCENYQKTPISNLIK